ncbi:MAG: hypothetical protein JWM85_1819, partial [Acidimicrobiaceae bacterium]|nr:hypothetical protein [Acidimicrobiaceae bacterium]
MNPTEQPEGTAQGQPGPERSAEDVVAAFLACGGRFDVDSAEELLDEHVVRIGSDGSVRAGRDDYLGYLRKIFTTVTDYRYEVRRLVASRDGSTVLVEIDEEVTENDGNHLEVSEAMVFDLTAENRIRQLAV